MFTCPICGKELREDEMKCPVCGFTRTVQAQKPAEPTPAPEQTAASPAPTSQSGMAAFVPSGISRKEEPPKKKKGKVIGLCIALPLIAILLVGVIFWEAIYGFALRSFSTPERYYEYVSEHRLTSVKQEVKGAYAAYLADLKEEVKNGSTLSASVHADENFVKELLHANGAESAELTELIAWINSLKLSVDLDTNSDRDAVHSVIGIKANETELIAAKLLVNMAADQLYLSLPGLSDSSLKLSEGVNFNDIHYDELPDEEVIADLFSRYTAILAKELPAGEIRLEKGGIELDSDEISCYELRYEITDASLAAAIRAISFEMEDDKAFAKAWNDFRDAGLFGDEVPDYNDLVDAVKELASEMRSESEGEEAIQVVEYIAANNQTMGVHLFDDESDGEVLFFFNGEQLVIELTADDSDELSFTLQGSCEGDEMTAEGKVHIEGMDALNINLVVSEDKCQFEFSLAEDAKKEMKDEEFSDYLDSKLVYIVEKTGEEEFRYIVDLKQKDRSLVSVQMEVALREAQSFSEPDASKQLRDPEQFGATLDLEELLKRLEDSGFPVELLQ